MGVNRLTRGKAAVGTLIGTVQAAAGSISSTELGASAVTTAKIAANAVDDTKYAPTVTSVSSTVGAVTVEGINLLVSPGSSVGNVFTIGVPSAGQHHVIVGYSGIGGSSKPTCLKSTSAAFTGNSTEKVLQFQANGAAREIIASSTTRWIVVPDLACSTGVVAAATT